MVLHAPPSQGRPGSPKIIKAPLENFKGPGPLRTIQGGSSSGIGKYQFSKIFTRSGPFYLNSIVKFQKNHLLLHFQRIIWLVLWNSHVNQKVIDEWCLCNSQIYHFLYWSDKLTIFWIQGRVFDKGEGEVQGGGIETPYPRPRRSYALGHLKLSALLHGHIFCTHSWPYYKVAS